MSQDRKIGGAKWPNKWEWKLLQITDKDCLNICDISGRRKDVRNSDYIPGERSTVWSNASISSLVGLLPV